MCFFSRDLKTLEDLFVYALREFHNAENYIARSVSDMIDKGIDPASTQGFNLHRREANNQIVRLQGLLTMH